MADGGHEVTLREMTLEVRSDAPDATLRGSAADFTCEIPASVASISIGRVDMGSVRTVRSGQFLRAELPVRFTTQQVATLQPTGGAAVTLTIPPTLNTAVTPWAGAAGGKGIQSSASADLGLGLAQFPSRVLLGVTDATAGVVDVAGGDTMVVTAAASTETDAEQKGVVACGGSLAAVADSLALFTPPILPSQLAALVHDSLASINGGAFRARADDPSVFEFTPPDSDPDMRLTFTAELREALAGDAALNIPIPHTLDLTPAQLARQLTFSSPRFFLSGRHLEEVGLSAADVSVDDAEHEVTVAKVTGGDACLFEAAITIPQGAYTHATLQAALDAKLKAAAGGASKTSMSVAFDAATRKFTVACADGADFALEFTDDRVRWAMGFADSTLRGRASYTSSWSLAHLRTSARDPTAALQEGVGVVAAHAHSGDVAISLSVDAPVALHVKGPNPSFFSVTEASPSLEKATANTLAANTPVAITNRDHGSGTPKTFYDYIAAVEAGTGNIKTTNYDNQTAEHHTVWALHGAAADVTAVAGAAAPRARFWASDFSVAHVLSLSTSAASAVARPTAPIVQATEGVSARRPPRVAVDLATGTRQQRGHGLVMSSDNFLTHSRDFVVPEWIDIATHETRFTARSGRRTRRKVTVRIRDGRDPQGAALAEMADAMPVVVLLRALIQDGEDAGGDAAADGPFVARGGGRRTLYVDT